MQSAVKIIRGYVGTRRYESVPLRRRGAEGRAQVALVHRLHTAAVDLAGKDHFIGDAQGAGDAPVVLLHILSGVSAVFPKIEALPYAAAYASQPCGEGVRDLKYVRGHKGHAAIFL